MYKLKPKKYSVSRKEKNFDGRNDVNDGIYGMNSSEFDFYYAIDDDDAIVGAKDKS